MILSIYKTSEGKNTVEMDKDTEKATMELRSFLFERVYKAEEFKKEEERADRMLTALYGYYKNHIKELPDFYRGLLDKYTVDTVLCDYVSGMSDGFAIKTFSGIFVPKTWKL